MAAIQQQATDSTHLHLCLSCSAEGGLPSDEGL